MLGSEWMIDASGCDPLSLADLATMRAVCERLLVELDLHVVGEPQWHQFPSPGGVTGMYLLSESHLTCHTFPEHGMATFNLYCCRERPTWDWRGQLQTALGAENVRLRCLQRSPHESNDDALSLNEPEEAAP